MPIYEFRCAACGHVFEALRPMGDTGRDLTCAACGAAPVEKILSTFATRSEGASSAASCGGSGSFG